MTRTKVGTLTLLLALAGGTPAAPPPAAPASGVPLAAGDSVAFDLSGLPSAFEGEGKAVCTGTRVLATGPQQVRCERPFRFEVPVEDARMVYTFRAKAGGRESKIELPISRATNPVTFVAPAEGTLVAPPPTPFPEEAAERAARKAAGGQCDACVGEGFTLLSFEVTRQPLPPGGALPVRIAVTSKVAPAK